MSAGNLSSKIGWEDINEKWTFLPREGRTKTNEQNRTRGTETQNRLTAVRGEGEVGTG